MSLSLVAVIVSGLAIGYWLVNAFLSPPADLPQHATGRTTPGDDASEPSVRHWSEVLGIPEDADAAGITAAYRRMLAQFHEDTVDTTTSDAGALARQRIIEIEAAYLAAMRDRQG